MVDNKKRLQLQVPVTQWQEIVSVLQDINRRQSIFLIISSLLSAIDHLVNLVLTLDLIEKCEYNTPVVRFSAI